MKLDKGERCQFRRINSYTLLGQAVAGRRNIFVSEIKMMIELAR